SSMSEQSKGVASVKCPTEESLPVELEIIRLSSGNRASLELYFDSRLWSLDGSDHITDLDELSFTFRLRHGLKSPQSATFGIRALHCELEAKKFVFQIAVKHIFICRIGPFLSQFMGNEGVIGRKRENPEYYKRHKAVDDSFLIDLGLDRGMHNFDLIPSRTIVANRKIALPQEILALYSPFFNALLFGDFCERRQSEVTIQDVTAEELEEATKLMVLPSRGRLESLKTLDAVLRMRLMELCDRFCIDGLMNDVKRGMVEGVDSSQFELVLTMDETWRNANIIKLFLDRYAVPDCVIQLMNANLEKLSPDNIRIFTQKISHLSTLFSRRKLIVVTFAEAVTVVALFDHEHHNSTQLLIDLFRTQYANVSLPMENMPDGRGVRISSPLDLSEKKNLSFEAQPLLLIYQETPIKRLCFTNAVPVDGMVMGIVLRAHDVIHYVTSLESLYIL
ncbi:hypothetical protein PFISCL1PPCAC_20104, partial [Pristionchus fissidentatus]